MTWNWLSQNFEFLSSKNSSPCQFFGSFNSRRYWISKLLVATWKTEVWEQNCVWLFCYFKLQWNYDVLKNSNSSCFLLKRTMNFNKNKTESKTENPPHTSCYGVRHFHMLCLMRVYYLNVFCLSFVSKTKALYDVLSYVQLKRR